MKRILTRQYQQYTVTTDTVLFDIDAIHQYLTRSSRTEDIDIDTVKESINNSLYFVFFDGDTQIGFAGVIIDGVTFGYLCDVYVLEEWQHQQLGRRLMECCQSHPVMARLRRIMLVTSTWFNPGGTPADSGTAVKCSVAQAKCADTCKFL